MNKMNEAELLQELTNIDAFVDKSLALIKRIQGDYAENHLDDNWCSEVFELGFTMQQDIEMANHSVEKIRDMVDEYKGFCDALNKKLEVAHTGIGKVMDGVSS